MERETLPPSAHNSKKCGLSTTKIAIIALSVVIIIALIVGLTLYFELNKSTSSNTTPLAANKRVDCAPDKSSTINQSECLSRGCNWTDNLSDVVGAPLCFYPPSIGYHISKADNQTIYLTAPDTLYHPFGQPIPNLKMTYEYPTDKMVHFKIVDADNDRYEVPVQLNQLNNDENKDNELMLEISSDTNFFNFQIIRQKTSSVLIDTSIGGFVYSDQFLQLSTYLPSEYVYGFGENTHQSLKHDLSQFKTWPMFARDQAPESQYESRNNLYGVHPFYLVMESDTACHGVLIFNSNAQEYTLGPGPSLAYRTIGGIFDIYVFSGPSPTEVIQQYWSLIGYPSMVAYWSLGFQLSRYGYHNLQEVEDVVERTKANNIPQDVQYVDIDYMDGNRDFTIDPVNFGNLSSYVRSTQKDGLKWIFILDPAISVGNDSYETFTTGLQDNIFITWPNVSYVPELNFNYSDTANTILMLGTVWPDNNTAFPDYFKNATKNWWVNEIVKFYQQLPFDGLWIDMNEPSNFGTDSSDPWYWNSPDYPNKAKVPALQCTPTNKYDNPPYPTQNALFWGPDTPIADKTVCMVGIQGESRQYKHYDVHNLFGWSESIPTQVGVENATKKRGVVIARSTFPSSGKYTGHWLGDNNSNFADLRTSIIGMLEFNMFGIPYIGADICGFNGNTTEKLCARWMQLGAFYPFCRNHNTLGAIPQDPGQWPSVAKTSSIALNFRYWHLPYLYTLFYKAHTNGEMVVRPLFFEFPSDKATLTLDHQFMWGPAFTVVASVDENDNNPSLYLPFGSWYSVSDFLHLNYGMKYPAGFQNVPADYFAPLPTFVRGGYIVPRQVPALNTTASRQNPFQLLVAVGDDNRAFGDMFWDNGESIELNNYVLSSYSFTLNKTGGLLIINTTIVGAITELHTPNYSAVDFLGLPFEPDASTLRVNGDPVDLLKNKYVNNSQNISIWLIEGSNLIPFKHAELTWLNAV